MHADGRLATENGERLYERATGHAAGLGPLWFVDAGRLFFAGQLTYNAMHQHGAPVFLAGIYGPFRLRIHGSDWLSCRTAVIPAGVLHELDMRGEPLAVFYIEPSVDGADALIPLMGDVREVGGALVGRTGEFALVRELWEDSASARWTGEALDDLLAFARPRAGRSVDPRIARIVDQLARRHDERTPVRHLAADLGLSASRFQHLFTQEVGVPFRRYRAWRRIRVAIGEVAAGSSFTQAAHAAGFADQAHFSRDFRRTFGAPPSHSMLGVRR